MHLWKGDGFCNILGITYPAISIRSNGIKIKNFGVKGSPVGIEIVDSEDGSPIKGISIENVELKTCYKSLMLPERSVGLLIKNSILE